MIGNDLASLIWSLFYFYFLMNFLYSTFSLPIAATVLNSVQPQLQAPTQTILQPQAAALQSVQQAQGAPASPATVASVMHKVTEPSASVAALQTTGLTINPAIVSWWLCIK